MRRGDAEREEERRRAASCIAALWKARFRRATTQTARSLVVESPRPPRADQESIAETKRCLPRPSSPALGKESIERLRSKFGDGGPTDGRSASQRMHLAAPTPRRPRRRSRRARNFCRRRTEGARFSGDDSRRRGGDVQRPPTRQRRRPSRRMTTSACRRCRAHADVGSTQFKAPPAPRRRWRRRCRAAASASSRSGAARRGRRSDVSSAAARRLAWRHLAVGPKLGEGGYAVVYAAAAVTSGAPVVVKHIVAPWRNATDAQRTFREIMHQRDANHPNLLPAARRVDERRRRRPLPRAATGGHRRLRGAAARAARHRRAQGPRTGQLLCALKYLHSGA